MKRFTAPLMVLLLAACAPAPEGPAVLEPVVPAPETDLPSTEAPVGVPAEPPTGATVTQLEPPEGEEAPNAPVEPAEAVGEEATGEAVGEAAAEPAAPPSAPQGTVSISDDGETFVTGEDAPVTVLAGETFTLQLEFADPDGVSALEVELRNSEFAGALPTGPFTVNASDCDAQLAAIPTEVSCTLEVAVAPDAQPIAQEGEFAYAFRPNATDSLGNSALAFSWAYLIVEPL